MLQADEPGFRINAATLPDVTIRIENTTASGLGEPLPAGSIRFFQGAASGTVFVGESSMPESPVGTGIELEHGTARDLLVEGQLEFSEGRRASFAATYTLLNDKAQPVVLEISQLIRNSSADLIVDESSRPYERYGDYIVWRIDLPPGSESLSYRISAREL